MNTKVYTELWFGGPAVVIVKCSFVVLIPRKSLKEAEDFLSKPCIFGDHPGHGAIIEHFEEATSTFAGPAKVS